MCRHSLAYAKWFIVGVPSLKGPYPYWSIGIIRLNSEKVVNVISLAEYSICRTWNRRVDETGGTIEWVIFKEEIFHEIIGLLQLLRGKFTNCQRFVSDKCYY